VTGHWRKLQNEELHDSNSSNIVWVIKPRRKNGQGMWKCPYVTFFVTIPAGKIPLERPRPRRDGNIKMQNGP
jgi:hypothetical protein